MSSGIYAACAALMAQTDSLDTIANNLANVSTNGFRARQNSFASVLASSENHPLNSVLNQGTNNYGVLGAATTSTQEGSLTNTGNPMDLALSGDGFFAVATANGTAYTRNGAFRVSATGQLITADGHAVLGQTGTIQLLPGAAVSVSPDGTVSSGDGAVGRLRVVTFAPGTDPQNAGGSLYTAPAASVKTATDYTVQQGMLESSDVNPVSAVVTLINAQRSAEAMRHALSLIDGQMDKTAAQELPRVSGS